MTLLKSILMDIESQCRGRHIKELQMVIKKYKVDLNKTDKSESIFDYSERMYRENAEEFGKPKKPAPSVINQYIEKTGEIEDDD